MNRINLSAVGVEQSPLPGSKMSCFPAGDCSEKSGFRSMLIKKHQKIAADLPEKKVGVKSEVTGPGLGKLQTGGEDCDSGEAAVPVPVAPEVQSEFEEGKSPASVPAAAVCTDELCLHPPREPADGMEQRPSLFFLNRSLDQLVSLKMLNRQKGELIAAGAEKVCLEPRSETTGQFGARFVPAGEVSYAETLLAARSVKYLPGIDPGAQFAASGDLKKLIWLQAGAEPEGKPEGSSAFLYDYAKTGDIDNRSIKVQNHEPFAGPLFPEVEWAKDSPGVERMLTSQFQVGHKAVGNILTSENATAKQGPNGAVLPNLNSSVLEQLCGCCTYLRERADLPAEIRLALDPPELGELLIRVVTRQGKFSASIIVETAAVKKALAGNLHELLQRFEQNNLHFERVDLLTAGEMSLEDHRFKRNDCRGKRVEENGTELSVHEQNGVSLEQAAGPIYDGAVNYWV